MELTDVVTVAIRTFTFRPPSVVMRTKKKPINVVYHGHETSGVERRSNDKPKKEA